MKGILSFLLVISVSLLSVSKSLICCSYQLNKEFISKHLCENRDKPKLHCNGKCHITKKMNEENNKENLPYSVQNNLEIQLYSQQYAEYNFSLCFLGEIQHRYQPDIICARAFSIFQPPKA
jgi:hypothetical protein